VFDPAEDVQTTDDPKDAAESAGLRYVLDDRPGIQRRKAGAGFTYLRPDGSIVDGDVKRRIRSLAIPPAWTGVWICPYANGHIQATGRDAKGRKQYKYHPRFRELRDSSKFERLISFAEALPLIRDRVRTHMALRGLPREKVLATVVHLLETTLIRIGNDDYAQQNGSYGLTTLKCHHAAVDGTQIRFRFTGKGGKQWSLKVTSRRVAKVIKACQELPGQELLQYVDDGGEVRHVTSSDVNAYLREITGENITAKDFRTWFGTVLGAMALKDLPAFESAAQAKRNVRDAVRQVADVLHNTATICRKCYIHPEIVTCYMESKLVLNIGNGSAAEDKSEGLAPEERAVLALLRKRVNGSGDTQPTPRALNSSSLRGASRATKQSRERRASSWIASLRSQ
jgi:DNA topoisomerase-1